MVWHKLDERTRNMYTLDITIFGALMILLSYGQTGTMILFPLRMKRLMQSPV